MGGNKSQDFQGDSESWKAVGCISSPSAKSETQESDGGSTLEASRPETQKHQASVQGQRQAKASVPAQMPPGRGIHS